MTTARLPMNPGVAAVRRSSIRAFSERAERYPDAVSLTIGQPDFATPAHVKSAGIDAIRADHTVYTTNAGLPALRHAVSDYMAERYGAAYDPDTQVIVTTGASQALDIVFRTILEPGSEVVIPAPAYPGYEPLLLMNGARPVFVDTTASGFRIDAGRLDAAITDRTRAVVVPSPNPTGTAVDAESLAAISRVVAGRGIYVLSDEIYSEITFAGPHACAGTVPDIRDQTIVINGLSKSHAMTGWRIGFTLASAALTEQLLKAHQYSATCATSISQFAAIEALTTGRADAEPMRDEYRRRRDYGWARLRDMGLPLELPTAAFYLFPSIERFGLSSFDFAVGLLEHSRVAVVPGSAFDPHGEGHVRISYACSMETLTEGMDRLEAYLSTFG